MAMNMTVQIGGHYKLQAFVPGNPPRLLADWFPNLITDSGMDMINNGPSTWNYCSVGSSNAPPAFSNTQLGGFKKSTYYKAQSTKGAEEDYVWRRITYQFAQGEAAGNLAEIGIGANSNGTHLFSRALIKDAGGLPTTVTVLPDEVLQVTWEFRLYYPAQTTSTLTAQGSDVAHSVMIDVFGKEEWASWTYENYHHDPYETRYFRLYSGVSGLFPVTQQSIPSSYPSYILNANSTTQPTYINGSFAVKKKVVLPVDKGNFAGGINFIQFQPSSVESYQVFIDPPLMKTDQKQLTLNFSFNWARA